MGHNAGLLPGTILRDYNLKFIRLSLYQMFMILFKDLIVISRNS